MTELSKWVSASSGFDNRVQINWGDAVNPELLLQVDNTDFGNNWPIVSSDTETFNGQLASYYARSSDLLTPVPLNAKFTDTNTWRDIVDDLNSAATDKSLTANQGRVLKDLIDNINAILISDETSLDDLQEIVNFIQQNKATLDTLTISNIAGLQSVLNAKQNALGYTPVMQGGGTNQFNNTVKIGWGANSKLLLQIDATDYGNTWPIISANTNKLDGQPVSYFAKATDVNQATTTTRGTIEKSTTAENNSGAINKFPDAAGVKAFVDSRLAKPAAKHYAGTGNVAVNFSTAIKHVVTRLGAADGTINLSGAMTAGDELVIHNVLENSGVVTITGKNMIVKNLDSDSTSYTTNTFTGQGTVSMTAYNSNSLIVTEVK